MCIRLSSRSYASRFLVLFLFFFFTATATTEIYTLSLHDALPISTRSICPLRQSGSQAPAVAVAPSDAGDRKSTRLNSSHTVISYAVFCLKKKKTTSKSSKTTYNDNETYIM